jgi:hypothetical protein
MIILLSSFASAYFQPSSQGVLAIYSSSSAAISNPSQPDTILPVTIKSLGQSTFMCVFTMRSSS